MGTRSSRRQDYYVTHEALRQSAARYGARVKQISLYDDIDEVSPDSIVGRIRDSIGPRTRVVALTWVHSSTGLKLPLRELGEAVAAVNNERNADERVLLSIDGVHGFGIEDIDLGILGG